MSYGTSLYDKIIFFYSGKLQQPGGIRMVSENFEKNFLTFLGLGTNVVKVSSVNSELLFQWDTLMVPFGLAQVPVYFQQLISEGLSGLDFAFGYLDAILIYSFDLGIHLQHLYLFTQHLVESSL